MTLFVQVKRRTKEADVTNTQPRPPVRPTAAAALTWSVVAVEDGEGEEGSVAVGSERRLSQGGQVVHVVETGAVRVVVAGQQQVDMVRGLGDRGEDRSQPLIGRVNRWRGRSRERSGAASGMQVFEALTRLRSQQMFTWQTADGRRETPPSPKHHPGDQGEIVTVKSSGLQRRGWEESPRLTETSQTSDRGKSTQPESP